MKSCTPKLSHSLLIISYSLLLFLFTSCGITAKIARNAGKVLITDTAISKGFIGISIFDPSAKKYLYNYNEDKYFVPASNVKLFTLYAGMKYLGDSLAGLRYNDATDSAINIYATGDPTFLHPDFKEQPVLDFLLSQHKTKYLSAYFADEPLGYGWAWDDYNDDYMVERNSFPVHGNFVRIQALPRAGEAAARTWHKLETFPPYFTAFINKDILRSGLYDHEKLTTRFEIRRNRGDNLLSLHSAGAVFTKTDIPFVTNGNSTAVEILKKDFSIDIKEGTFFESMADRRPFEGTVRILKSRPVDSLFKPMMHNSDNFFAEQTLLMASNEVLKYMSDKKIIDTLLKSDLKNIPQKPKWVDGSGLSRYNLFTPQDFIFILNKMKEEFGMERMKTILPTGGGGTLKNYFKNETGFIYAKTGTLSNNCALSGYIITKKNKLLIFSMLVNNYQAGATPVRKAMEKFLKELREKN